MSFSLLVETIHLIDFDFHKWEKEKEMKKKEKDILLVQ